MIDCPDEVAISFAAGIAAHCAFDHVAGHVLVNKRRAAGVDGLRVVPPFGGDIGNGGASPRNPGIGKADIHPSQRRKCRRHRGCDIVLGGDIAGKRDHFALAERGQFVARGGVFFPSLRAQIAILAPALARPLAMARPKPAITPCDDGRAARQIEQVHGPSGGAIAPLLQERGNLAAARSFVPPWTRPTRSPLRRSLLLLALWATRGAAAANHLPRHGGDRQ